MSEDTSRDPFARMTSGHLKAGGGTMSEKADEAITPSVPLTVCYFFLVKIDHGHHPRNLG